MAQRKTGWRIWLAGTALGFLWIIITSNLLAPYVAAQERSTSVGAGKGGGSETTSPAAGGRKRSSNKAVRPPVVLCPSGPLAPTVALPAEQLSTLAFESPKLDDKGNTVETIKGETQRFVEDLGNQVTLELVAVPGGCFTLGNTVSDESESYDNERPPMRARVFGFYMGRTEVTQAQWREVASWPKVERDLPPSPSRYTGDDLPVDSITWDEAVEFCRRLTKRTGRPYRLPTEAEWEYACRAGATGLFAYGAVLLPTLENYDGSLPYRDEPAAPPRKKPTPAGSLGVNAFGLADMHGNVREWCLDTYTSRLTGIHAQGAPVRNIRQEEWAQHRTIRGGSWASLPDGCRCSIREGLHREELLTTLGFRVVLSDRYGEGQPTEPDDEGTGRASGSLRLNERTSAPAFSHGPAHPHP